jgi:hypothetical protein
MIVSHKHKFIIALPTKNGTNSFRNMALGFVRNGGDPDIVQELPKLRHRMDVPEGCEGYQRAIVIREPYSRVASMYEYLRRHSWEWKYDQIAAWEAEHGREDAWRMFLRMLVAEQKAAAARPYTDRRLHGKRPFIWTDTQMDLVEFLAGKATGWLGRCPWPRASVRFIRLNAAQHDLDRFTADCGMPAFTLPPLKQSNKTKVGDLLYPGRGPDAYFKLSGVGARARSLQGLGALVVGRDAEMWAAIR